MGWEEVMGEQGGRGFYLHRREGGRSRRQRMDIPVHNRWDLFFHDNSLEQR